GLAAKEPVPGLVRTLVQIAESGLARRGRGEERLLEPVWRRIERRQSPGLRARQQLERGGIDALIGLSRFRGE
ncbi:MAG: hypothetical protein M1482_03745, partial [Chloroflexi bacterium]|nr:hypothetical protein [Chloroflexota bacterium]